MNVEIENAITESFKKIKYNKQLQIKFQMLLQNRNVPNFSIYQAFVGTEFMDFDKKTQDIILFVLSILTTFLPNDINSEERQKFSIKGYSFIEKLRYKKMKQSNIESYDNKVYKLFDCKSSCQAMEYIKRNLLFYLEKESFNAYDLVDDLIKLDRDDSESYMRNNQNMIIEQQGRNFVMYKWCCMYIKQRESVAE